MAAVSILTMPLVVILPLESNDNFVVVLVLRLIAPEVIWTFDLLDPTSPITTEAPKLATSVLLS